MRARDSTRSEPPIRYEHRADRGPQVADRLPKKRIETFFVHDGTPVRAQRRDIERTPVIRIVNVAACSRL